MKLVKHLLLASAASLVAGVGVQAQDFRATSVKICSVHGVGFYFIPGADTCVALGGSVRADYGWNVTGNNIPQYFGVGGAQTRATPSFNTLHRGEFDIDARTDTAYGTLQSFMRLRMEVNGATNGVQVPRAFIQWSGFTFGRVKSLSDVVGPYGEDGGKALHQIPNQPQTGEDGNNEISYTWELGNGMALHVGAGERRTQSVANLSNFVWDVGGNPVSSIAAQQAPNPFVAFKVSQAWGRWDTSVTGNSIRATYYTAGGGGCTAQPGTSLCDHPSDQWGWAVASGALVNTPWIAPGDIFGVYGAFGVGASSYATGNNLISPGLFSGGNNVALGALTDAVYLNGSGLELTTSWTAGAYFTHYWTPAFSSTVFGTHSQISYNDTVIDGRWFCGGVPGAPTAVQGVVVPAGIKCDPGFGFSTIGTHTDWYPVPSFRIGIEVMYTMIDTAFNGSDVTLTKTPTGRPTGAYTARDEGIGSVIFRAQRAWPADEPNRYR